MSDANREAIERMFVRVVAAARKVGLSDDEIRLIVDVEILGEGMPTTKPEPELEEAAKESTTTEEAPDAPRRSSGGLIPELDGPPLDWDGDEEQPRVLIETADGKPPTLEGLGLGKVTTPIQLKPPPKTKEEKDFVRDVLGGSE